MKMLAELGRTPLKINIEIQTFKYLQRFAFIEKERFSRRKSGYRWVGKIYEIKTGVFGVR